MDSAPEKGTLVRFTATLGAVETLNRAKFVTDVHPGDTGRFLGPHPSPMLEDWYLVEIEGVIDGGGGGSQALFVPVGLNHIEVAG